MPANPRVLSDANPRVLMIIETFGGGGSPDRCGSADYSGAAAQLRAMAPRLREAGVDVRVLTSHLAPKDAEDVVDGTPVVGLAVRGGQRRSAQFAQRVPRWMFGHRGEYDIVHIHGMTRTALAALTAARVLRKRSVLKFTLLGNDDPLTVRASRFATLKMRLLGLADVYAAPSTALADAVREAGLPAERIAQIPNGVDLERFAPAECEEKARLRNDLLARFSWPRDALVVLFVGAIDHRKGVDVLAQAWPEVVRRAPQARLLLVGPRDGARAEMAARVEAELDAAGVAETAALVGYAERPEDFYRASDLFVFPSRGEGLPNALIEAHAAGLASVAAEIPGITRDVLVDGETGVVAPQEDAPGLADSIAALLKDDARRLQMATAARKRAADHFSLDRVARQYAQLYATLTGRG